MGLGIHQEGRQDRIHQEEEGKYHQEEQGILREQEDSRQEVGGSHQELGNPFKLKITNNELWLLYDDWVLYGISSFHMS